MIFDFSLELQTYKRESGESKAFLLSRLSGLYGLLYEMLSASKASGRRVEKYGCIATQILKRASGDARDSRRSMVRADSGSRGGRRRRAHQLQCGGACAYR